MNLRALKSQLTVQRTITTRSPTHRKSSTESCIVYTCKILRGVDGIIHYFPKPCDHSNTHCIRLGHQTFSETCLRNYHRVLNYQGLSLCFCHVCLQSLSYYQCSHNKLFQHLSFRYRLTYIDQYMLSLPDASLNKLITSGKCFALNMEKVRGIDDFKLWNVDILRNKSSAN